MHIIYEDRQVTAGESMSNDERSTVHVLVELLNLERDRPPEFQDAGQPAHAWQQRVAELEKRLHRHAHDVWILIDKPTAAPAAPATRTPRTGDRGDLR